MSAHKKPRFQRSPKKEQDLDTFAQQAERSSEETMELKKGKYPWEDVDAKEKKTVPLYLSKDVYEKLRYLSENTDIPQQRIMRNVLVPEIERQLNELLKKIGE